MSEKLPGSRNSHYFWHGAALKDPLEVDGDEIVIHRIVGRRTAQNAPRSKHFTRVSVRAAACGWGVDVQQSSQLGSEKLPGSRKTHHFCHGSIRRRPVDVDADGGGRSAGRPHPGHRRRHAQKP